jgi:hypothetical protein
MTAIYIAVESGLVSKESDLLFADLVNDKVVFRDLTTNETCGILSAETKLAGGRCELVLTGAAFNDLRKTHWIQDNLNGNNQ